ncbi:MAG: putative ABC transporter permease, partial [Spirochaetales bacterium]|nr:putative ABC transporter permease [Spirochaetales bacterium]
MNEINHLLLVLQNWLKYYFLVFIIYSFIGWIIESGYRTVLEKGRFINSGSLFGPFVPIYGFGATAILLIELYIGSLAFSLQIIIFSVTATAIEYLTSYILEKKFSMRFWDYSTYPLNIKGRVCLLYSGFWALLSAIQIVYIQPFIDSFINSISLELQLVIPV